MLVSLSMTWEKNKLNLMRIKKVFTFRLKVELGKHRDDKFVNKWVSPYRFQLSRTSFSLVAFCVVDKQQRWCLFDVYGVQFGEWGSSTSSKCWRWQLNKTAVAICVKLVNDKKKHGKCVENVQTSDIWYDACMCVCVYDMKFEHWHASTVKIVKFVT